MPAGPRRDAPPIAVIDLVAECEQVAQLAGGGDHKPAVDAFDALAAGGGDCETAVDAAVAESRRLLAAADELVRRGLEARRAGDAPRARTSFEGALDLYPKYYWVQRLVQELPSEPDPAETEILQRASDLRAAGRLEEALVLLESAATNGTAAPALAAESARVRIELGDRRLGAAYREQRAGNLEGAVELTRGAIAVAPGEPVRGRVVDFARRLGLNLFSAGELLEARDLWRAALGLDEGNELLGQYLEEVETRLRSLDDIKAGADG